MVMEYYAEPGGASDRCKSLRFDDLNAALGLVSVSAACGQHLHHGRIML